MVLRVPVWFILGAIVVLWVPMAGAEEAARVVPLEGHVGPYFELQGARTEGGSLRGWVALQPNETRAHAYLEVEERSVGRSDGFQVWFCREVCRLDNRDAVAMASGPGPIELTFSVEGLNVVHYRVSIMEGVAMDARVTGSLSLFRDAPRDMGPAGATTIEVPAGEGSDVAVFLFAAGLVAAVLLGPRLRRLLLMVPFLGLFTRKETLLDHPVRRRLHAMVARHPGIHLRALRREMGITPGQLDHHLQKMVQAGFVATYTVRGYTAHFVPGTVDRRLMASLARIRSDAARSLLATIAQGTDSLGTAAETVGIALSTASYHIGHLERLGLVEVYGSRARGFRATALGRAFLSLVAEESGSVTRNGPGNG